MLKKRYDTAKEIASTLQNAGFIAYFAGGFVRDFIMGHPSDDIDIATDASVAEMQRLFEKTIPVGVAFGILIVVKNNIQFEVATFRKDRGYVDGRRPIGVDPATPKEDAKRRDFTINGMFYDPISETLYDYVEGKKDIEKKLIKAIGNPDERIFEDRLRMMRAVRYATRFGFTIEERTLKAIKTHASDLLPAVAMERIWQEFKKMSQFFHFDKSLLLLNDLGLLSVIFPDLKTVSQREIKKRLSYLHAFPKDSPTFAMLLELFPTHNLEEIYVLSDYLKLSNQERAFAKFYHHATSLYNMPTEWLQKLEKFEWAQFYADPFADIGLAMIAIKKKDPAAFLEKEMKRKQSLHKHVERIMKKKPYLSAEDLMKGGILPSEHMGKLLSEGMRIAINEEMTDPKMILEKLKQSPIWLNP